MTRYSTPAIMLHWLMALMIIGLFALGLYMHELPFSLQKLKLYSWHKWTGITVFVLVLARLYWRKRNPPPPMTVIPPWQQWAAHYGHITLYTLMLIVPLSGWLMSSAKGVQTVWFGVVPLPDLLAKNEGTGELLESVHKYLNYLFMVIVAGHLAAALQHHFLHKDDTLKKMAPWLNRKQAVVQGESVQ